MATNRESLDGVIHCEFHETDHTMPVAYVMERKVEYL